MQGNKSVVLYSNRPLIVHNISLIKIQGKITVNILIANTW